MANNSQQTDYYDSLYIYEYDDVGRQIINERIRRSQSLDLDIIFVTNSTNTDLVVKKGENSVKQSLKSLLLTDFYEKLFRPNIGSNIKQLLFEPVDFISERILEDSITNVIDNYEPRVNLISVSVTARQDEDGYDVVITYSLKNTNIVQQIDTFLQSTRG